MRWTTSTTRPHRVTADAASLQRGLWAAAAVAIVLFLLATGVYGLVALAIATAAAVSFQSYADNEVQRDFNVPIGSAWAAAVDALADNGRPITQPWYHGVTEGRIRAGSAKIVVELHPGTVSRVRIRVGLFAFPDNRRRAALLLESVVRGLDTPPVASRRAA